MYERTRIQALYLEQRDWAIPAAMLDTDILIAKDFSEVFQQPIDVGLTWRKSRDMPFNGGVIFVNNRDPDASTRFFKELESVYSKQSISMLEWYGDQHALTTIIGHIPQGAYDLAPINRGGITVGFFACDTYNYTPRTQTRALFGAPPKAKLLHFKGSSRRLMLPYWQLKMGGNNVGRIGNLLALLWAALRLRFEKSAYQSAVRNDGRRFYNCDDQAKASWRDRAEVAADLIVQGNANIEHRLEIVDLGCGDCKLARALLARGLDFDYAGYDLHPQAPDVKKFDVTRDHLSRKSDVVAMLGVLEYLTDAQSVLEKLKYYAPQLVVSHFAGELQSDQSRIGRLNWATLRSTDELSTILTNSGWIIREHRRTPDGKTNVWLCSVLRE